MISLFSTLLFAASASAQLTTSFWAIGMYGGGRLGYEASVINVQDARTTLELSYDNRTETEYVLYPGPKFTMTVGPTIWETEDVGTATAGPNADSFKFRCEKNNPSVETANGTCTYTYGHLLATSYFCASTLFRTRTSYLAVTRTYSGSATFSVGVETVMEVSTRTVAKYDTIPAWCTESKAPDAAFTSQDALPNSEFATYQVVITAGMEKLKATQGASASSSGATPTGSSVTTASPAVSQHSGAAMPIRTASPVIVGLGAAFAAFRLWCWHGTTV